MKYLVDVNVISEPTKPNPNSIVVEWLKHHEISLVLDAVILGEVRLGVVKLPRGLKRQRLEAWFDSVVQNIVCIPWSAPSSMRWAQLVVDMRLKGRTMQTIDSMIAATALTHDFTLATRNTKDFKAAGVRVFNPFTDA